MKKEEVTAADLPAFEDILREDMSSDEEMTVMERITAILDGKEI
jgi:hypothetical protein